MTFAVLAMTRSTVRIEILPAGRVSPDACRADRKYQERDNPNANSSPEKSNRRQPHTIASIRGPSIHTLFDFKIRSRGGSVVISLGEKTRAASNAFSGRLSRYDHNCTAISNAAGDAFSKSIDWNHRSNSVPKWTNRKQESAPFGLTSLPACTYWVQATSERSSRFPGFYGMRYAPSQEAVTWKMVTFSHRAPIRTGAWEGACNAKDLGVRSTATNLAARTLTGNYTVLLIHS
jgi:hypothetical protein